jgi:hypothetical protein
MIGVAKMGTLFAVIAFVAIALSVYVAPVTGQSIGPTAHTAVLDLDPEWSPAGQNVDYDMNLHNNGPDSIDEIRIFKNPSYSNFQCDNFTGWTLVEISNFPDTPFGQATDMCWYYTGSSQIPSGGDATFEFSATVPQGGCDWTWYIETRDNVGQSSGDWETWDDNTSVDDIEPMIKKTLGKPQVDKGGMKWISQSTPISIEAYDQGQCGISGLNYCQYRYDVDGSEVLPWTNISWDSTSEIYNTTLQQNVTHYYYTFTYQEDSEHFLEIRCYDNSGKMAYHSQTEKVDDEEPDTIKTISQPKKIAPDLYGEGDVEWVDTTTVITLDAVDPDPTTYGCNIGVKEIWWANTIVADENCMYPDNNDYCNPVDTDMQKVDGNQVVIQKGQESCHLLQYFAVDELGNTEQIQTNCFFVDKTPPVLTKTVGDPEIPDEGIGLSYDLSTKGSALSELVNGKIHIQADKITGPTNEGRIVIPVDSFRLKDIYTIEWDAEVMMGYMPHVDVILDFEDGGTDRDDALVFEYAKVDPNDCDDAPYPTGNLSTFDDKGIVDDTAYTWLSSGPSGDCSNPSFIYGSLADWKAGLVAAGIDGNTKVHSLEIEVDGWIAESEAYIDVIKLNGVGMRMIHWVNSSTLITLECMDQQPHPSGDEKICYKVSFDDPAQPYLTDQYCGQFGGDMEGEWCCDNTTVKQVCDTGSVGSNVAICQPFDINVYEFYFMEDSEHDLVYYCEDAVKKRTPTYLQYYKVDNTPPNMTNKWINGPYYEKNGDCPPNDPTDICHIDSNSSIDISVVDGGPICAVDGVTCVWEYVLDDGSTYGPYRKFPIIFPEETKHDLTITCRDALGNTMTDTETFYVDKTPPQTTKTYVGPQWPNPITVNTPYPHWVDTVTEVVLTATDSVGAHDSGVKETMYRVTTVADMYCDDQAECEINATGSGSFMTYTGNFTLPESCQLIEYYSIDNVDKIEPTNKQCVYSDHTKPVAYLSGITGPSIACQQGEGCDYWVADHRSTINLGCRFGPNEPHPAPLDKIYWRIDLDGQGFGPWQQADAGQGASVIFTEDSVHTLEYYCTDKVQKISNTMTKVFRVDSTPPIINKTVGDPWIPCPPLSPDSTTNGPPLECHQIDGKTVITVNVTDPDPTGYGCAVDQVVCEWGYWWLGSYYGPFTEGPLFTIINLNESEHIIDITCRDALDNTAHHTQRIIVDKTPPVIWKDYGTPKFPIYLNASTPYPHYISSKTPIFIYADDINQPHPSGLKTLEYKYKTLSTDSACFDDALCQLEEVDTMNPVQVQSGDNFTIPQDSCHLIEIRAVDGVDKEAIHKQCVIVDNQAPVPNKTVGEPKSAWDGLDAKFYNLTQFCQTPGNCWRTTILTPIELECIDPQPHPVDHEEVCFKVELDAQDYTQMYCNKSKTATYDKYGDGFCCQDKQITSPFYFGEVSEHNLAYYCVDALGNKGPIDDEKFKVEDTAFEIELNRKWNLISVPVKLLDDSMDEVFKDVSDTVMTVWTYDGVADMWYVYTPNNDSSDDSVTTMLPGWGYWVLSNADDLLVIGGSLFSPAMTPPNKQIAAGWNLIGYYGAEGLPGYYGPVGAGDPAKCELNSLGISMWDKGFTSLWTYWEPDNPNMWKPLNKLDNMDPGAGYWLLAQEDGSYAPSTTCL